MVKIAIDADSLLYKACYRVKDEFDFVDIDEAYAELEFIVYDLERTMMAHIGVFKHYKVKLVFSPSKSFRNIMYPDYKANRPKQRLMGIKEVKEMALDRMSNAILVNNIEADDLVIRLAYDYNYIIAAIDKDVLHASPTMCYNYNKGSWHRPRTKDEIERWYYAQALMGDSTDNIKGAKGIGEIYAWRWVNSFEGELPSWEEFVEKFNDSETDAMLNMRLVRMDQVIILNNKIRIKLWIP